MIRGEQHGSPSQRTQAPLRQAFRGGLPRRVALFRALQLGDLLCAVPALRGLRTALPASEIILVGLPWARVLVERYPGYLDGFREFPGWPGLPEQPPRWHRIAAFLEQMQQEQFDLVVQLHGSGLLTNPLVALFRGRRTAGFCTRGGYRPDPELFLPFPEEGLEVRRLLGLVEFLGMRPQGEELEFPVFAKDRATIGGYARRPFPGAGSVCVHPPRSQCAPAASAGGAVRGRGTSPAPGPGRDPYGNRAGSGPHAAHRPGGPRLSRSCRSDRPWQPGSLAQRRRLLVCNDTGVSHLAAASHPERGALNRRNPARWRQFEHETPSCPL